MKNKKIQKSLLLVAVLLLLLLAQKYAPLLTSPKGEEIEQTQDPSKSSIKEEETEQSVSISYPSPSGEMEGGRWLLIEHEGFA